MLPTCRPAHRAAFSFDATPRKLSSYLTELAPTQSLVVFVGAFASGPDDFADALVDEKIAISQYSLSASVAVGRLCCAFEDLEDVL